MVCRDNMPFSCVEKRGLQHFCKVALPRYKPPTRKRLTYLVELKYSATIALLRKALCDVDQVALTRDILTVTNSSRSFLVVTAHFLNCEGELESCCLSAERITGPHTGVHISAMLTNITSDFCIEKCQIQSITTDGGSNMLAAVNLFIGEGKGVRCVAHLINTLVNGVLKDIKPFSQLCDNIKSIVTFFKQSVKAMDALRAEQEMVGKKKGRS
ncbi:hypothetical protein GE061_015560 [Apolygus lucorum]|uniref:Uncharacterized protein n=1 Tax=Apolygus lucorum TaxID=248454 RepID=A0A8S9XMG5_APOLU|nr:hypothetical protein GE061_015560 [Apolygus lucorum]